MFIIKYKNIFLGIVGIIMIVAIGAIAMHGLKFGIDFTGGTLVEVNYPDGRPDTEALKGMLEAAGFTPALIQPSGETGVIVRTRSVTEQERATISAVLSNTQTGASGEKYNLEEKRFDSIGPIIGAELRSKSYWAIGSVILLIVLYITFAFRKVSKPVASWKYGFIAVLTLVHDVIVPAGFFAIYSKFTGAEVDILFVTALLAILGFSIHDTIVVFDRIRENLHVANTKESFEITVGRSLSQTFTRSINTSFTVVLTLLALIFVGGESTVVFALVLLVGIVAGTYSSIFVASPLLVLAEKIQKKK